MDVVASDLPTPCPDGELEEGGLEDGEPSSDDLVDDIVLSAACDPLMDVVPMAHGEPFSRSGSDEACFVFVAFVLGRECSVLRPCK